MPASGETSWLRSGCNPVQPRPCDLPAKDGELVTQDEDLQLLRATLPAEQPNERQQVPPTRCANEQSKQPSLLHDHERRT
jgi:hypothetical protein